MVALSQNYMLQDHLTVHECFTKVDFEMKKVLCRDYLSTTVRVLKLRRPFVPKLPYSTYYKRIFSMSLIVMLVGYSVIFCNVFNEKRFCKLATMFQKLM